MTAPSVESHALSLHDVTKLYGAEGTRVRALDSVSLDIPAHTFTAVMGPSGSGKSTLLNCAAGLDHPDEGEVRLDGDPIGGRSETALTKFRRRRVGFVFQSFNLLPYLTVQQNVALPMRLMGKRVDRRWLSTLLDRVGLTDRRDHRPAELSGGQQQRVAIARALIGRPAILFADEPTGALDSRSAHEVLALLRASVDDHGQTVVMVTHDPVAASYADSALYFADGRVVGRAEDPTVDGIAAQLAHLDDLAGATARRIGA